MVEVKGTDPEPAQDLWPPEGRPQPLRGWPWLGSWTDEIFTSPEPGQLNFGRPALD